MLSYDDCNCSHNGEFISKTIGNIGCVILVLCLSTIFINYVTGIFNDSMTEVYTLTYVSYTLISFTYFIIIIKSLGKIQKHKGKMFPTKLLIIINICINIFILIQLLNYLNITKVIFRLEVVNKIVETILFTVVLLTTLGFFTLILRCIINIANKLEEVAENINYEDKR